MGASGRSSILAMEVSPKTLREVEFREKMRGYHPEDVDHFLEQVASGIEVLQDRLRQAVERAQRAEAAAQEAGGADENLRKTLVLAQRTADMAVQEAREQASRILGSAEQQAQAVIAEAEERGRRTLEDTIAECRSELIRLEGVRAQAQQDVDSLQRWLDEHKAHLQESLADAMAAVERAGVLWPAPSTRPLDVGAARYTPPAPVVQPEPAPAPAAIDGPDDPDTVLWTPSDADRADTAPPSTGPPQRSSASDDIYRADPDDQALDDFFEDNGELEDDRRFGGRLRRRH
jgi:cell division initiation protein